MVSMQNLQRKAIESLYKDLCDIVEYQPYIKPNKSTGHKEVVVLENQPCRLSIQTSTSTSSADGAATIQQITKLFINPEITVNPGSKIIVKRNNRTTEYQNSGVSAVYCSHQEIILELFDGWA